MGVVWAYGSMGVWEYGAWAKEKERADDNGAVGGDGAIKQT